MSTQPPVLLVSIAALIVVLTGGCRDKEVATQPGPEQECDRIMRLIEFQYGKYGETGSFDGHDRPAFMKACAAQPRGVLECWRAPIGATRPLGNQDKGCDDKRDIATERQLERLLVTE